MTEEELVEKVSGELYDVWRHANVDDSWGDIKIYRKNTNNNIPSLLIG